MVKTTSFNVQGLNSKSKKKKKLADNFAQINQLCLILRQKRHDAKSNTTMSNKKQEMCFL